MSYLSSEAPKKKLIAKTTANLLKTPEIFTSKQALSGLRGYRTGQSTLVDMALWNVYKAVEAEKGFFEATAILEDTLTSRIKEPAEIEAGLADRNTKKAEQKKQEIYRKETEVLKQIVEEEGVIAIYDLMRRCHTRDTEKTMNQIKEAGVMLVDMRVLINAIIERKKPRMIEELRMLLGAKDIGKMRQVAMSQEYHKKIVEKIKS